MAKPDKPLFSFGARGTIADTLTYQKRGQQTIARQKPIPIDPYSLKQAYQRWDYRDYAYLWTLLSNSEKQVYRTKASRYHITGFNQWMREHLKDLPDLAGRWHLDEKSGAIAHDSSPTLNHGTIFGASPITGAIDGAFLLDGLNDYVSIPHNPAYNLPDQCSIELFVILMDKVAHYTLFAKPNTLGSLRPYELWYYAALDRFSFSVYDGAWHIAVHPTVPVIGTLYHLAGVFNGSNLLFYVNAIKFTGPALAVMPTTDRLLAIGRRGHGAIEYAHAHIDHVVLRNRALDDTEINRHSERRYPV